MTIYKALQILFWLALAVVFFMGAHAKGRRR